jgi:hypothetical protein
MIISPRVKEIMDTFLREPDDRRIQVKEILLWQRGEPYRTESLWKREVDTVMQSSVSAEMSGDDEDEDGLTG